MKLATSGSCCAIISMVAAFGAPSALAVDLSGLYVGASGGLSKIEYNNSLYQSILEQSAQGAGNLDFTRAELHKRKAAWWVNTGYMGWQYVGLDASYFDFGNLYNQVNCTFTPLTGSSENVGAATRIRSQGPALGVLLRLPLTEHFDFNFRLADYYGKTTLENILVTHTYSVAKATVNQSSFLGSVGAAYSIAGHWSAKIDYIHVQKAGSSAKAVVYNVDMAALGIAYTF